MSFFLLDTNVISEVFKPRPEPAVLAWLDEAEWVIPVPVLAELQDGASGASSPQKRQQLDAWLNELLLTAPVLAWDAGTSRAWGRLKHLPEAKRRPQSLWDSLIDAMAFESGGIVATRNHEDFRHAPTFNPWTGLKDPPDDPKAGNPVAGGETPQGE